MRKYKWLIILSIIIFILTLIAIVFQDNENKYIKEISINEVLKMKENKKSFILYIKQTTCDHCKEFNPKFISALKKSKLKSYTLNISNFSNNDQKKYDNNFDINGTPTVLFFTEGEESLIKIEGSSYTKDKIISKFKATGFLK